MSSPGEILEVRLSTNEASQDTFTDAYIGGLIDASSIAGATATIWEQKAAGLSGMADVTEAGATHKMSDLFDNAMEMAAHWRAARDEELTTASGTDRVRVAKMERS